VGADNRAALSAAQHRLNLFYFSIFFCFGSPGERARRQREMEGTSSGGGAAAAANDPRQSSTAKPYSPPKMSPQDLPIDYSGFLAVVFGVMLRVSSGLAMLASLFIHARSNVLSAHCSCPI
jgi:hypothetical protein